MAIERNYVGVEIDGTETTLSKDARITLLPNGNVVFAIYDAYEGWRGEFTVDQLSALAALIDGAHEVLI